MYRIIPSRTGMYYILRSCVTVFVAGTKICVCSKLKYLIIYPVVLYRIIRLVLNSALIGKSCAGSDFVQYVLYVTVVWISVRIVRSVEHTYVHNCWLYTVSV